MTGSGLVLKSYAEVKNFRRKIKMSRFTFTTYEKILSDIRFFLRSAEFHEETFPNNVKLTETVYY